jgi:O-acetyl-ADP-ribose deacetylase (regulator of RNase III)
MSEQTIKTVSLPEGKTFSVVIGNLLNDPVDCIVNAANGALAHGGGVAAVIAKTAGPALVFEGNEIVRNQGEIPVGDAVVTTAGELPFKGVIHAVGPRKGEGDEEDKLVQALRSSFMRAAEKGWKSLSFPAVSSGIFAVPLEICASAYVRAAFDFFKENPASSLQTIRLCLFEGPLVDLVCSEMEKTGNSID